jgi:hypothetical protein
MVGDMKYEEPSGSLVLLMHINEGEEWESSALYVQLRSFPTSSERNTARGAGA